MLIEQCQAIWNQSNFHQLLRNKARKMTFMLPIWSILKLLSSKRHDCFVTPPFISLSTLLQPAQQDYADRQLVTRVGTVELHHRKRASPSHETINGKKITCAMPLLSIHTHSITKHFCLVCKLLVPYVFHLWWRMKATAKVKAIVLVSTLHTVLTDSSFPFSSFLCEEILKIG